MHLKNNKRKNKLIICITGPAGSGKTTLSNYLKEKGFCVILVDELGHKALDMEKEQIEKVFGNDVIDEYNKVNRKALRKKLKTEKDWEKLEKITHTAIYKLLLKEIEKSEKRVCIVDAAILFTLGIDKLCNVIIKIESPTELLKERLKKRDMDDEFIYEVLKKQKNEYKGRPFDYTIYNQGALNDFLCASYSLIKKILKDFHLEIS